MREYLKTNSCQVFFQQKFNNIHFVFNDAISIQKDQQKELMDQYATVKKLAIGDCSADHELFPELILGLIPELIPDSNPELTQSEMV